MQKESFFGHLSHMGGETWVLEGRLSSVEFSLQHSNQNLVWGGGLESTEFFKLFCCVFCVCVLFVGFLYLFRFASTNSQSVGAQKFNDLVMDCKKKKNEGGWEPNERQNFPWKWRIANRCVCGGHSIQTCKRPPIQSRRWSCCAGFPEGRKCATLGLTKTMRGAKTLQDEDLWVLLVLRGWFIQNGSQISRAHLLWVWGCRESQWSNSNSALQRRFSKFLRRIHLWARYYGQTPLKGES